jgi:hypothetical protein
LNVTSGGTGNQTNCGWCHTKVILPSGIQGPKCVDKNASAVCDSEYDTFKCTVGYFCDHITGSCKQAAPGAGTTMFKCKMSCTAEGPTPAPPEPTPPPPSPAEPTPAPPTPFHFPTPPLPTPPFPTPGTHPPSLTPTAAPTPFHFPCPGKRDRVCLIDPGGSPSSIPNPNPKPYNGSNHPSPTPQVRYTSGYTLHA